jgi:high-affinity iron transporter
MIRIFFPGDDILIDVEIFMLPAFLLSLREGMEIGLIIGIVLGALHKMKRTELRSLVWAGAICAGLVSVVSALILYALGTALEGPAEAIFEGLTMLLAASVLTWMIFWMHRQARTIKGELESGVQRATVRGGKQALFSLAFLAVLREGIELALFLTVATFTTNALQTVIGVAIGLAGASALGWLLFASTVRLDLRRFFLVTGALLILFASGLVAHGVHEFNEVGWIPAIVEHVWDMNPIFNENSTVGSILTTLFGYNGNPSLTEVIAYLAYFGAIGLGLRLSSTRAVTAKEA